MSNDAKDREPLFDPMNVSSQRTEAEHEVLALLDDILHYLILETPAKDDASNILQERIVHFQRKVGSPRPKRTLSGSKEATLGSEGAE